MTRTQRDGVVFVAIVWLCFSVIVGVAKLIGYLYANLQWIG